MKILILGVNGFIGYHLTKEVLASTDWEIYGMDIDDNRIRDLENSRLHFVEGDIEINKEWIEYHIKKCDVVMPLVAIATPKMYVEDPLRVFHLDFEANLDIIKKCAKYKKRIVFPSTSEVYGISPDPEFDEDKSPLCTGPINKERWIYSASKQLLDRVIWAYGNHENLPFTLFRPFNWIGPKLDSIEIAKEGSSRVVTQFIASLLFKKPIYLVDGGKQMRSFTYISDGIDALIKILKNENNVCDKQIINIGNPNNNISIKDLAYLMRDIFSKHEKHKNDKEFSQIIEIDSKEFYGESYQDIYNRKPSIKKAKELLNWEPKVALEDALKLSIDAFINEYE
ncbi:MAG: bifunctional UDP-4-keto-pentose/UDP-xylose synthase [Desulfurella multipotens]|nr:bifunctional UDP-4-keto-pentose/UDP-xylose synthase [Desulfurella multipotens]PMP63463.1 MAG: bifunctional UDP-4-keto-pentose/UDP-xylose synthase [Desulfurella multipotens]